MRDALLAWYDAHARDLPWRRTRDPYAVWVSEVMLQQTRVETVVPYYERFLARFPTVEALAAAAEEEVLAAWSGLGYYRRARLLHAGVREVVARHGGRVPEDAAARRALPGVGAYTAGAIGSIAFDREEPLVDGNVARVLARVHGVGTPLGRADTEARLWAEAARLVRGPRPGALNQALMELGATVCTPRAPRCGACPIAARCEARARGDVEALPVPRAKKAPREVALVAVVAVAGPLDEAGEGARGGARGTRARGGEGGAAVWLVRTGEGAAQPGAARARPATDGEGGGARGRGPGSARAGLGRAFAGLHGPPLGEGRGRAAAVAALAAAGLRGRVESAPRGTLVHVLTHRRLAVEVWRAEGAAPRRAGDEACRRVPVAAALARHGAPVGLSTLARKAIAAALGPPAEAPARQRTIVRRPSTTTRRSR